MAKDTPDTPEPTVEDVALLLTEISDRLVSIDKRLESLEEKYDEMAEALDETNEALGYLAYGAYEDPDRQD